jgi:hypothetical protein
MCLPRLERDDELCQLPSDDVLTAIAERLLSGLVELAHEAFVVDDDDAVERCIEDRLHVCRTELQRYRLRRRI